MIKRPDGLSIGRVSKTVFARRYLKENISEFRGRVLRSNLHIVIHPKYRTIGLGAKLIQETLPQAGTPYVELIAVMAKYSPFAEKAGMQKIAEQQKAESVSQVSKMLSELGFDLQFLGSERYVQGKLQSLSLSQIRTLKEALIKSKHPRFKKEFAASRHQPFGKTSVYTLAIRNANCEKIAKLIKLVGMLLQTKVYLFWPTDWFPFLKWKNSATATIITVRPNVAETGAFKKDSGSEATVKMIVPETPTFSNESSA